VGTRTLLLSAPVFFRYAVSFTSVGKEEVALSSADSMVAIELEGGSWTVGEDYLAAMGEAVVSVIPGQPVDAQALRKIFEKDGRHPVVGHHDTGSLKKTPLKPHLKDC
jgi:hypothetical protein